MSYCSTSQAPHAASPLGFNRKSCSVLNLWSALSSRKGQRNSQCLYDIEFQSPSCRRLLAEKLWTRAGKKQAVRWIRHYLVAVTSSHSAALSTTSHALQLFDLRNKFIAASIPLTEASPLGNVWPTILTSNC